MLDALFIQLFGRDTADRLSHAGLDEAETISLAGAGRVAEAAGVPPELARRIVAFAGEVSRTAERTSHTAGSARRRAPQRSEKRATPGSGRAKENQTIPGSGRAATAPPEDPPAEPVQAAEERHDPFVDEASLVSWMGFAGRSGMAPSTLFGVSDDILGPLPQEVRRSEDSPSDEPPEANGEPLEARRNQEAQAGSFWSFGGRHPAGSVNVSPSRPDSRPPDNPAPHSPAKPDVTPRRRSRDGH